MDLLRTIDRFLKASRMPPTKFGRLAMGDPRFVGDLRNGREPRAETAARAIAWIAAHEPRR